MGEEIANLLSTFQHQSEAFKLAWKEWELFRREQKKTFTPSSVDKQLKLLAQYSEADAIAIIEKSIRNGWQGLFDLKSNARTESLTSLPQHNTSVNKPYRELV